MSNHNTSQTPLVTIVTPSYNQGRFIEETIQSVLAQTYPHVEYIVVDGNSTDDTHRILEKYADRIDHLIIEPDEGQSDAINKGFRLASGVLVGWLNSDDVLLPRAVEATVACFRQHPTGSIFYGGVIVTDERGHDSYNLDPPQELTFEMLVNGNGIITQPGSFYPANRVHKIGGLRPHFYMLMDRDLWLRLLQLGNGQHTGIPVARFRRHDSAKSSEPPFRLLEESLILSKEFPSKLFSWRTLQIARYRLQCITARIQHRVQPG